MDNYAREHSVEITFFPYPPDNERRGVIILFKDLSETQQLNDRLSHEASHDTLTGLMNRQTFEQQLSKCIQSMRE